MGSMRPAKRICSPLPSWSPKGFRYQPGRLTADEETALGAELERLTFEPCSAVIASPARRGSVLIAVASRSRMVAARAAAPGRFIGAPRAGRKASALIEPQFAGRRLASSLGQKSRLSADGAQFHAPS